MFATVERRFAWSKQILHVWCDKKENATAIESEFAKLPSELRASTIVLLTVAENCDCIFSSAFHPLPMAVHAPVTQRR
jgi:hypothetical protein